MTFWPVPLLIVLCSTAFSLSAQTDAASPPLKAETQRGAGVGSQRIELSDLLTNSRFKVRRFGTCLVPRPSKANTVAQLSAEMDKETREEKHGIARTCPIDLNIPYISVMGIWESEVIGVSLVSPEQVWVQCEAGAKECRVVRVRFDLDKLGVSVEGPDETDYQIVSWDDKSVFATHDADLLDRCHRSVLTINGAGGDVSVSDIPTREKGCEIFKDTNSYRLVPGNYYVDTTPNNDSPEVEH